MSKREKSRPLAAQETGQAETAAYGRAAISYRQCTTAAASRQMVHIADFLSYGAENGVTLRHLEKLTDLPGREVRRQIEGAAGLD